MLQKPNLDDAEIVNFLRAAYGLPVTDVSFLPLGADQDTAVYRAATAAQEAYFVKLRRGVFREASITVPWYLAERGLAAVITPLSTQTGRLWADMDAHKLILYPYVEGRNGFEVALSDQQRVEFGAALKVLHTTVFPEAITRNVPLETFSPRWRHKLGAFLEGMDRESPADPTATSLTAFLAANRAQTLDLIKRAETLAGALQAQRPEFNLCHGDIHAWNLLLTPGGALYIVDWDTLVFAPKERDLMFVGSGLGGRGHTLAEEEDLFYQGYGRAELNQYALAYYRYERIIEDIAVYCEEIFETAEDNADRRQALVYLQSNFRPGGTIEIARRLDKAPLGNRPDR